MGTYAPTRIAPPDVIEKVHKDILQPTIDGMRKEAFTFKGVLFTGLMMTKNGAKVLEYNVRFGDPETQSLLALMESDLAEVMIACAEGRLEDVDVKVSDKSAATVVVAAGGYPGSYAKGTTMTLDSVPEGNLFPFPFATPCVPSHRPSGWSKHFVNQARCRTLPRRYLLFRQHAQDIWGPRYRVYSHRCDIGGSGGEGV
jgi:hypothetical protein